MSSGKKRQTMAKNARERAVKERRALKLEKKREAAYLRLANAAEQEANPSEAESAPTMRLVPPIEALDGEQAALLEGDAATSKQPSEALADDGPRA